MSRTEAHLRRDALHIWRSGLAAVDSERLVVEALTLRDDTLRIADESIDLAAIERIVVVGGGKAGAGMAAGVERVLGPALLASGRVDGQVNVPADCLRPLERVRLHAARPAGQNEPTAAGVEGTARILALVAGLGPRDLALCLISGGGSALLPAPAEGLSLADKRQITLELAAAGADIVQLNTVRKHLSRIKGGRLAAACRAGRLVTLLISDVPGDPLEVIASGPTLPDPSTPADALAVLERFARGGANLPAAARAALRSATPAAPPTCRVSHHVIGNNGTAVAAAARAAEQLGYACTARAAEAPEGPAEEVGRQLAAELGDLASGGRPACLVSGGEPTVALAPSAERGLGGRNQQLALAALTPLAEGCKTARGTGLLLLSGGTDGEDGPTDAAGAIAAPEIAAAAAARGLDPDDYLRRNDAYHFFDQLGALIRTGPTHTNVCDVRVGLVAGREAEQGPR